VKTKKKSFGKWGEIQAKQYLEKKGFNILATNYYTRYGEIDIVAKEGEEIVFIEVKTRSSHNYGFPEEAVTEKKQEHMIQAAAMYFQTQAIENVPWRLDVISITCREGNRSKFDLLHFENVTH
jgi:putative endonuclease